MIPESAIAYVVGYGEMTVGQIRAEKTPQVSQWEQDLRTLEGICTVNLSPDDYGLALECRDQGREPSDRLRAEPGNVDLCGVVR